MMWNGLTTPDGGARRASLAGFGALALSAALAVVVSSGPAAADTTTSVANLSVSASASMADALPGESLIVAFDVTNDGSQDADGVAIFAALDAGLSLTNAGAVPVSVDISAGSSVTLSFELAVDHVLDTDVSELTVDVSTSTGASATVTVEVLTQELVSIVGEEPAP